MTVGECTKFVTMLLMLLTPVKSSADIIKVAGTTLRLKLSNVWTVQR